MFSWFKKKKKENAPEIETSANAAETPISEEAETPEAIDSTEAPETAASAETSAPIIPPTAEEFPTRPEEISAGPKAMIEAVEAARAEAAAAPEEVAKTLETVTEVVETVETEAIIAVGAAEEAAPEEAAKTLETVTEVVETVETEAIVAVEPAEDSAPEEAAAEPAEEAETDEDDAEGKSKKRGLFGRLKDKLAATRERISGRVERLLSSVREIDDDVLDELEEILITADLGVKTTQDLLFKIRGQVARKELKDPEALKEALKRRLTEILLEPKSKKVTAAPYVIMVVGINGVGKTTSIAKLSKNFIDEGRKVLLAAGDTFRSAAVDQLGIWAKRLGCDIVAQPTGADPSAVVFDALTAAHARSADVVIIDTAGRLHTKVNLMDELKKIKRVADKAMPGAPHETILVLDANTGQNALRQAQTFHEAVGVDSIVLTKLDGTSKGGVIVSIANELKIPVTHIGLGEGLDDLKPFDPKEFSEAILG